MKKIIENKLAETVENTIKELQNDGYLSNIKEFTLDFNKDTVNIQLKEDEEPVDLKDTIIKYINNTDYFTAKEDGHYVRVLLNGQEVADFNLENGIKQAYHGGLIPSSRGDGKNTFRVCDVSLSQWDEGGRSFFTVLENEEKGLPKLGTEKMLTRYFVLKSLYNFDDIYGHETPKEANNWHCAQWGTWKFIIDSLDKVEACIAALQDAYEDAHHVIRSRDLHESVDYRPVNITELHPGDIVYFYKENAIRPTKAEFESLYEGNALVYIRPRSDKKPSWRAEPSGYYKSLSQGEVFIK